MTKPQRNVPCPCGSGRKYKHCCLAKDEALASGQFVKDKAERTAAEALARQKSRDEHAAWLAMRKEMDEEGEGHEWFAEESNAVIDLINAGKLDEAEAAARMLLERYPNMYDGYDRLGMVEEARGNRTAAAHWYRKCLESIRENREGYDPELPARYERYIAELEAPLQCTVCGKTPSF